MSSQSTLSLQTNVVMSSQSDCRGWNSFTQNPSQNPSQTYGSSPLSPYTFHPSVSTGEIRNNQGTHRVPIHKSGKPTTKVKVVGPKANWEPHLVETYIRLCVSDANNGNRPGAHFSKHGWQNLVMKFQLATGLKYTRDQLKNKWDTMTREWRTWKSLIGKDTGLGWDHIRATVDATPEWWERKLKVNPEATKFRTKGPLFLDEKEIQFADNVANGEESWTPSSGILPNSILQEDTNDRMEENEGEQEGGFDEHLNEESNIESQPDLAASHLPGENFPTHPPKTPTFKPHAQMKPKLTKKLTTAQQVVRCLDKMCDEMDTLVAGAAAPSVFSPSSVAPGGCSCANPTPTSSINECLSILGGLDGVVAGGKMWLYATRILLKPNVREMFVGLPSNELRIIWLADHMDRDNYKRRNYGSMNSAAARDVSEESNFGHSS